VGERGRKGRRRRGNERWTGSGEKDGGEEVKREGGEGGRVGEEGGGEKRRLLEREGGGEGQ